jgi:hypothetical protein
MRLKYKSIFQSSIIFVLLCTLSFPTLAEYTNDIPILGEPSPIVIEAQNPSKYSLVHLVLGAKAETLYSDNIYRSSASKESDIVAKFSPKLGLRTNFIQHSLGLTITPEIGRYFSETKNNYLDWDIKARGQYDLSLTEAINIVAGYRRDHVAIGAFDDDPSSVLSGPVEYDLFDVEATLKGIRNLVHYELGASLDSYNYDNVARDDGTISIQDDRDRDIYEIYSKLGYEFALPYVPYVRGGWNSRAYDNRIDSSLTYPRDSDGYEIGFGIMRDLQGEAVRFDGFIGYLDQRYDAAELDNVSGLDAGLEFSWTITPSNSLEFTLDREVKDQNLAGVSASLQTSAGVELTHQYNEKISFNGFLDYTRSDYETNRAIAPLDRLDHIYQAGAGAIYDLTEDASIGVNYTRRNRESNQPNTDYDSNLIGATLSIKY